MDSPLLASLTAVCHLRRALRAFPDFLVNPIKVTYSEQCLREASRSYWWYRFGSQYLFILIPVVAFLGYRILADDIAWFIWVIGVGALYYATQMIFAYFLYLNGQIRWLQSLKNPECTLEFNKESLLIKSDNDASGIEWKSVYDIRYYRNSLVLVLSPYMLDYSVLPIDGLSQDAKLFITSQVNSVLFRSDQGWKIRARLAFSYLGMFFVFGPWAFKPLLDQYAIYFYSTGGVFAVISLILSFAVRCPKCGKNWDTKAAKVSSSGRWPLWLFALQKCPFCGSAGEDLDGR